MTLAKKGKILAPLHNFQKRHVKFYKKWMVFELHILPSQNVVLFPHVESLCMFWLLRLIYWWSLNKNCISNNGNVQMWKMISAVVTQNHWSILDMGRYWWCGHICQQREPGRAPYTHQPGAHFIVSPLSLFSDIHSYSTYIASLWAILQPIWIFDGL